MATNYEKRKAKVEQELQEKREEIRSKVEKAPEKQAAVFTQTGMDIFSPDNGRSYKVAEISYNPLTGEALVTGSFDISRLVALTYLNQKQSLNSLKRRSK